LGLVGQRSACDSLSPARTAGRAGAARGQGQQGETVGRANPGTRRDPLGRQRGAQGQVGTDQNMLPGNDVYGRARELLDEIRRRSADQSRPNVELEYLKRLLDKF